MIPFSDVSRRPTTFPIATLLIIAANFVMFGLELAFGDSFVLRWSLVPAQSLTSAGSSSGPFLRGCSSDRLRTIEPVASDCGRRYAGASKLDPRDHERGRSHID